MDSSTRHRILATSRLLTGSCENALFIEGTISTFFLSITLTEGSPGTTVSHLVLSRLLHTEKWAWKQSWTVEDKGFMMVVPTARTLALT